MLSHKAILEFQKLFEKEYGKKCSYEEAAEMGENLVRFFEILIVIDQKQNQKYIS